MFVFLQSADVGKRLGLSSRMVRELVARGALQPAGMTLRGHRLFLEEDVQRLREVRMRQAQQRRRGGQIKSAKEGQTA